jgi:hypothetical protein
MDLGPVRTGKSEREKKAADYGRRGFSLVAGIVGDGEGNASGSRRCFVEAMWSQSVV